MSKVRWRNNKGLGHMEAQIKLRSEFLKTEAEEALGKSVEIGAVELQDLLEAATTRTGLRREELEGGFPGRHDTGNMVGGVSHNGDDPRRDGKITWASFGWFPGEFEKYMRDQDLGAGNIPAARAMSGAFVKAREDFLARMRRIAKGKSAEG